MHLFRPVVFGSGRYWNKSSFAVIFCQFGGIVTPRHWCQRWWMGPGKTLLSIGCSLQNLTSKPSSESSLGPHLPSCTRYSSARRQKPDHNKFLSMSSIMGGHPDIAGWYLGSHQDLFHRQKLLIYGPTHTKQCWSPTVSCFLLLMCFPMCWGWSRIESIVKLNRERGWQLMYSV